MFHYGTCPSHVRLYLRVVQYEQFKLPVVHPNDLIHPPYILQIYSPHIVATAFSHILQIAYYD
jgi:hypothetical protein